MKMKQELEEEKKMEKKTEEEDMNKNKKTNIYTPSSHDPEKCICQCENACIVRVTPNVFSWGTLQEREEKK